MLTFCMSMWKCTLTGSLSLPSTASSVHMSMSCLTTLAAELKSLGAQLPDALIALQTSPIAPHLVASHENFGSGHISVARSVDSLVCSYPYLFYAEYPSLLARTFFLVRAPTTPSPPTTPSRPTTPSPPTTTTSTTATNPFSIQPFYPLTLIPLYPSPFLPFHLCRLSLKRISLRIARLLLCIGCTPSTQRTWMLTLLDSTQIFFC